VLCLTKKHTFTF